MLTKLVIKNLNHTVVSKRQYLLWPFARVCHITVNYYLLPDAIDSQSYVECDHTLIYTVRLGIQICKTARKPILWFTCSNLRGFCNTHISARPV